MKKRPSLFRDGLFYALEFRGLGEFHNFENIALLMEFCRFCGSQPYGEFHFPCENTSFMELCLR